MFDKLQAMTEEYSRNPTPKLLKEIQDTKKHIPQHQEQLNKPTGTGQVQTHIHTHARTRTHAHRLPSSENSEEFSILKPKKEVLL